MSADDKDIPYIDTLDPFSGILSFFRVPYAQDPKAGDIAVLGIPFDLGASNRAGARLGPRAIREQSAFVGEWSWGVWPWEYDFRDHRRVIDYGDVTGFQAYPKRMLENVEKIATDILAKDAHMLSLGGDHMVALPLLRAHAAKHGPLALVHFDAHSDTWIDEDINHGTMFYHALQEGLIDPKKSIHIGLRTPNPDTHGIEIIDGFALQDMGPKAVAEAIRNRVGDSKAYLTFDIDFLDPVYAPGTGTPVVGGPSTIQARQILLGLRGMNFVGGDLVEVSPPYDPIGAVTALAGATLAGDIIYLIHEGQGTSKSGKTRHEP